MHSGSGRRLPAAPLRPSAAMARCPSEAGCPPPCGMNGRLRRAARQPEARSKCRLCPELGPGGRPLRVPTWASAHVAAQPGRGLPQSPGAVRPSGVLEPPPAQMERPALYLTAPRGPAAVGAKHIETSARAPGPTAQSLQQPQDPGEPRPAPCDTEIVGRHTPGSLRGPRSPGMCRDVSGPPGGPRETRLGFHCVGPSGSGLCPGPGKDTGPGQRPPESFPQEAPLSRAAGAVRDGDEANITFLGTQDGAW